VTLDADESALVERLAGRVTIAELLATTELERRRALALLVALRYAGALVSASTPARAWIGDRDPFAGPAPDGPPPPTPPSIEEAARVCYLLDQKLSALDAGADHYAILEVERRASPDAVKSSYRELAKIFHPDRHGQLSSADPTVKASLERVFQAVSTAYSTLSDAHARESYDRTLADAMQRSARPAPPPAPHRTPRPARPPDRAPAPPAPSPRAAWPPPPPTPSGPHLEAGQLELLGARYLEDGDYERAVHAFRKGTSVDPESAGCHAGLGRALVAIEGLSPAAEASLRRALALDGCSVDLVVEVATVFAEHGRAEDARILMKRALRLDPANAAARRALGLTEGAGREGVGGLIDRLLRR
jgi:DnaJ-domain-containing protein 1